MLKTVILACLLLSTSARAAEVSTNGVGGGPWSDPATWRDKKLPGPDDDVVIRKFDVVVFDRAYDGKPTCRKLQIDPKGGLSFKPGAGKLVLAVTDGIETFGPIRLDGTRSASDYFEIRLVGDTAAKRKIKLGRGAALLLFGRPNLPEGKRNVLLVSPQPADAKEDLLGLVEAEGMVMIDWQRAALANVKLSVQKIDNTGAKPNERIRVRDCNFSGLARVYCYTCDTPEFVGNEFANQGPKTIAEAALQLHTCPLAEIKANHIRGPFAVGINLAVMSDPVLIGNTVEGCTTGLNGGYGVPNAMIKKTTIRGCETGIKLEGSSGVVEDTVVEGATFAFYQQNSNLQLNNFHINDLAKKGQAVHNDSGTLALLNVNVLPADVKVVPQPPVAGKPPVPRVTCQQYLVIKVKDAPPGALVEVRTSIPAPAAGTADPNVRNTPAPLIDGLTPLPASSTPLVVNAWTIDTAGKVQAAPEYAVKVLGPAPKEGAARPLLKLVAFRPAENAFRAAPDDTKSSLEVSLK
jgi:hypothetical protein